MTSDPQLNTDSWYFEITAALSPYIAWTGAIGDIKTVIAFQGEGIRVDSANEELGLTEAKTDAPFLGVLSAGVNLQGGFANDRMLDIGQTWTWKHVDPLIKTDSDLGLRGDTQLPTEHAAGIIASNETSGIQEEREPHLSAPIVDPTHDANVIAQELEAWFNEHTGSASFNDAGVANGETLVLIADGASPFPEVSLFTDRNELIGIGFDHENGDTAANTTEQHHLEIFVTPLENALPELTIEESGVRNDLATNEPAENASKESTVNNPTPLLDASSNSSIENTSKLRQLTLDGDSQLRNEPAVDLGAPMISSGASFWTVSVKHLNGSGGDHSEILVYTAGNDISMGSLIATHLENFHG